jgi:hypothetical protein
MGLGWRSGYGAALLVGRSRDRFPVVSLDFSVTYFLPTKPWPWGRLSQGKGGRCVRLTTYKHIVPMSRNLGALTLLDLSGPAWPVMGELYL